MADDPSLIDKQANVIASDALEKHPTEAIKAAEVIAAVRRDSERDVHFKRSSDWSGSATDRYNPQIMATPEWTEERGRRSHRVDEIRHRQDARPGQPSDKFEKGTDAASKALRGAGVLFPGSAAITGGGAVVADAAGGVYRALKSNFAPANSQYEAPADVIVDNLAWATKQSMQNTPAGHALAGTLQTTGIDTSKPMTDQKPLRDLEEKRIAADKLEKIKENTARGKGGGFKKAQGEILQKQVTKIDKDIEEFEDNIEADRARELSARDAQATAEVHPKEVSTRKQIASGFIQAKHTAVAVAYGLQLFDMNKEAATAFQFAEVLDRAAAVFDPGDASTALITGNYFALALSMKNLLIKQKQPESPFPALFKALENLSKQIERMGESIKMDIARMDARLGALIENVLLIQRSAANDTAQIRAQINEIQKIIEKFEREMNHGLVELSTMLNVSDDQNCIRYDGKGSAVAPLTDFYKCRDLYVYRAGTFSRSSLAKEDATAGRPLRLADIRNPFALSHYYDEVAQTSKLPNFDDSRPGLPDPRVWLSSTESFLKLVYNNPGELNKIDLSKSSRGFTSATIDPMIESGRELAKFYEWIGLNRDGKPNMEILANLRSSIEELASTYAGALQNLAIDLAASGVMGDVTKSAEQEIPSGAQLYFQKTKSVGVCSKDVKPIVRNTQSIYYASPREKYKFGRAWDGAITDSAGYANLNLLQPPPQFARQISNAVLWLELLRPEKYRVEPCLHEIRFDDLNMDAQPRVTISLEYDIQVRDLTTNNVMHVQRLYGRSDVEFGEPFKFNMLLYNDHGRHNLLRGKEMVDYVWGKMLEDKIVDNEVVLGPWPKKMTPQLSDLRIKNEEQATLIVESLLAQRRLDIKNSQHLVKIEAKVEALRRRIATMIVSGSSAMIQPVENLLYSLADDPKGLVDLAQVVDKILSGKVQLSDEMSRIVKVAEAMKSDLDEIAKHNVMSPAAAEISDRLDDLEQLRAVRARSSVQP